MQLTILKHLFASAVHHVKADIRVRGDVCLDALPVGVTGLGLCHDLFLTNGRASIFQGKLLG